MIKILCFGDSNTYGVTPGNDDGRFTADIRWPKVLESKLGGGYKVIEDGSPSRTTNIDDPYLEGKNGKVALIEDIDKYNPIDIFIIFLGTNDLKGLFERTPKDIASGAEELLVTIKNKAVGDKGGVAPKVILLSPPRVDSVVLVPKPHYITGPEKSLGLGTEFKKVAEKQKCDFVDLSKHVEPDMKDGVHLNEKSHVIIAELLYKLIKK